MLVVSIVAAGVLSACASGRGAVPVVNPPVVTTAPSPTPASQAPAAGTTSRAPAARTSAPADWHRLDLETNGVMGVGSERAMTELLAGRQPSKRVIVAVIDGGVDTSHALLSGRLWTNAREVAGNARDDDGNGYVDDNRGWNFIGSASGQSVHYDTFEITRLYSACRDLPAGRGTPKPSSAECGALARAYGEKKNEVAGTLQQIVGMSAAFDQSVQTLTRAIGGGTLTEARVRALTASTPEISQAKQVWLQLVTNDLDADELAEARKAYDSQLRYGLDTTFNPRTMIGDDATRSLSRPYGNRDVTGPDALHGTHVAGIIGAKRGSGDVQGIAPNVEIMAIRTVPDGDERDDDVANAIRYAADNGAHIINMSFGKGYSPKKAVVDSAVRYAESKGVLLVHAAGNDAENIDQEPSFPSPMLDASTRAANWIEVGASSWKGGSEIPATFSNYGRTRVDIFAPGVDILSTVTGGKTEKQSGTSMAAPVVSGVAAMLMSYFPNLTAADVKGLLLESARRLPDVNVVQPGGESRVRFGTLVRNGAVIDGYAAVKLALQRIQ